jgi:hypothetical protein
MNPARTIGVVLAVAWIGIVPYASAEVLTCRGCGRSVPDTSAYTYFIDEFGEEVVYCDLCAPTQRCDACTLPLGKRWQLLPDGRRLCYRCLSEGVFTKWTAIAIKLQVLELFESVVGSKPPLDVQCQIVDARRLGHILGHKPGRVVGLCEARYMGDTLVVSIVSGLRPALFTEVLAHELAHAWLRANAPRRVPLEINEGFAEWVAYRVIEKKGYHGLMQHMLEKKGMYGEGLRFFLAVESLWGAEFILSRITTDWTDEYRWDPPIRSKFWSGVKRIRKTL